jgi:hypothetical protein
VRVEFLMCYGRSSNSNIEFCAQSAEVLFIIVVCFGSAVDCVSVLNVFFIFIFIHGIVRLEGQTLIV